MWFLPRPLLRKPLFFRSKTFIDGVVPAWFHVVPIAVQQRKPVFFFSKTFIDGVVRGSLWFLLRLITQAYVFP